MGSLDRAQALWGLDIEDSIYTRIGNPTVSVLERRVAALDGAHGALALSSGMAAISYVILALTEGGGNVIAPHSLYGGSEDAFSHFFPRFGANIKFAKDRFDINSFQAEIDERTRGIYIESISNPNAELYDIEALTALAHKHGIPLIVDNTFATPYLFRPLEHGADIVVYSATKALNGHGNAIGGVIVEGKAFSWSKEKHPQFYKRHWVARDLDDNERSFAEAFPNFPFVAFVRTKLLAYLGAALSPYEAQLILIGLETLSERVSKQVASARKIVAWLESRTDAVSWVNYPEAKNSRYAELSKKYFPIGPGSVFSFGFKGNDKQIAALLSETKIFGYQANVGDAKSLIVNSPKTTHGELRPKELEDSGILPETIRLSIGLEDADDLIADLEHAFKKAGF